MRNRNTLVKIIAPILFGLGVLTGCEKPNNENISKSHVPQSTYFYNPSQNQYKIDVERDGIEDITISDPYRKIKGLIPVEGGYKIIFNANKKGKHKDKMLASFENENSN